MGDREERKGGRWWIWVVAAVLVIAALGYVFVPAFIKYTRKGCRLTSRMLDMDKIRGGARQYYVVDHWDSQGNLLPKSFPVRIPMTPPEGPSCNKKFTSSAGWDRAGWGPLHFASTGAQSYAYEFWSNGLTGTAAVYTARGYGDMDCDGVWSTHELRGSIDNEGSVKVVGPLVTNEGE